MCLIDVDQSHKQATELWYSALHAVLGFLMRLQDGEKLANQKSDIRTMQGCLC